MEGWRWMALDGVGWAGLLWGRVGRETAGGRETPSGSKRHSTAMVQWCGTATQQHCIVQQSGGATTW